MSFNKYPWEVTPKRASVLEAKHTASGSERMVMGGVISGVKKIRRLKQQNHKSREIRRW